MESPPTTRPERRLKLGMQMSDQEVTRELHLERDGAPVPGICHEEIDSGVLRWNPNVYPAEGPRDVFACERFSGMKRKDGPHL